MRTVIATIVLTLLALAVGGVAFIYSGIYGVAATEPHSPMTRWALETARTRSIRTHAAGIAAPQELDAPAMIAMGTEHFAAHCAVCHGAPGVPKGDLAHGLNPQPPDLAHASSHYTPAELFWILKHGIKMTGMPAWADHSDEELWATVAFLEQLPGMSEQDYARLVMANAMNGGMHHTGGTGASPGTGDGHAGHEAMMPPAANEPHPRAGGTNDHH